MRIFVDTSAFLAVLNASDRFHSPAKIAWGEFLSRSTTLFASNYVMLETTAVLQNRFGIEAVRLLESDILPVVELAWVDETIHQQALGALLAANRRQISLVDITSFGVMRKLGLDTVFTFDQHFSQQGFQVVPVVEP